MRTLLKVRRLTLAPETFAALEYESDRYVSWAEARALPTVRWESEPLGPDELVVLLASRGWHQTDIGDELDEARELTGPEA